MTTLETTSTLAPIPRRSRRENGSTSKTGWRSSSRTICSALGELADLARRLRGGTDEVYFVQNLYLNQTNVCRVKCKFCAFAATRKQEEAYTITTEELVEDAVQQRGLTAFTEIHMVNGENPHVDFEFYRGTIAALHAGDAGRASQVLHGLRDPPHDDALGADARAGAPRAAGGRARLAARRGC